MLQLVRSAFFVSALNIYFVKRWTCIDLLRIWISLEHSRTDCYWRHCCTCGKLSECVTLQSVLIFRGFLGSFFFFQYLPLIRHIILYASLAFLFRRCICLDFVSFWRLSFVYFFYVILAPFCFLLDFVLCNASPPPLNFSSRIFTLHLF